MDKNIFVGQLADMAGLSGAQFVRLFKCAMNITPHQYIIRRRVDTAKKLLMATDASIAVIAQECGFSDQMHLTKCFSRLVGTSPAAYRRSRTS
ncbi:helix-turn-helix domain-containing protein [Daeguia caeni]|uniref:Helix-turn-helix domain-containing protein n=1 Tax=Daeguia caeni TaxID=439612 RepID=A0ABV9H4A3_9HYPH